MVVFISVSIDSILIDIRVGREGPSLSGDGIRNLSNGQNTKI